MTIDEHHCHCGKFGPFGSSGQWFCFAHYPSKQRLPYNGEPPAQKHSVTSQVAAASIKQHVGPLHQKILEFLIRNPNGASDEKMGRILDMGLNTLRPRRRELQLMGRVKDSGRTELTASGRSATIWVLEDRPC